MEQIAVLSLQRPAATSSREASSQPSGDSFASIMRGQQEKVTASRSTEKIKKEQENPAKPMSREEERVEASETTEISEKTGASENLADSGSPQLSAEVSAGLLVSLVPQAVKTGGTETAKAPDGSEGGMLAKVSDLIALAPSDLNIRQVEVVFAKKMNVTALTSGEKQRLDASSPEKALSDLIPDVKSAEANLSSKPSLPAEANLSSKPSLPAEANLSSKPSLPAEANLSSKPSLSAEANLSSKSSLSAETNFSSKPSAAQGLAVPVAEALEPQNPAKAVPVVLSNVPVELSLEGKAKESDKRGKNEEKGDDALSLKAAAFFKPDGLQKSDKIEAPREPVSVQVVRQTQEAMGKGRTEIRIQLDPEHLGGMTLKVVSQNGIVTATIHADNPQTKDLIEGQLAGLRQQFSEQGIKFDRVEVDTRNDPGFGAPNPNEQQRSHEEASRKQERRSNSPEPSISVSMNEEVLPEGVVDYRA